MGGSTTISTEAQRLGSVRIQTSSYGLTVPLGYGRSRAPGNLLAYDGFRVVKTTTTTSSGGKGGGVEQKDTTYDYYADAIMLLHDGPGMSVQSFWKGKDRTMGSTLSGVKTTTEILAIPSTKKVKLSFFAYFTAVSSVVLCADVNNTSDTTLTVTTDYTVSNGVITIVSSAHVGRAIRVTYTWTPDGSDLLAAGSTLAMTYFTGSIGQATWSYWASKFPASAIPYSGMGYMAAQQYHLNSDASFSNHNFEINFKLQYPGKADALPSDILTDLLTNPVHGAQFPAEKLGDLTAYETYCRAMGIFLSPVYIEQQEARQVVADLMLMTNSEVVWSGGLLKVLPRGDTAVSGNGASYTPNTTPVYALTDADFRVSGSEDPIKVERKTPADAFNKYKVEFLNRANSYNVDIAECDDAAGIELNGLRAKDPIQMHAICDRSIAQVVVQLVMQRDLYFRNVYKFKLGWKYCLLEPMDIVTLTDTAAGLVATPVRITHVEEDESGDLSITAEDFPAGAGHAPLYGSQTNSGYQPAFYADPGNVTTPAFLESPIDLVPNDNEVWIAVSGAGAYWGGCTVWYSLDGVTYKRGPRCYGSRYGTLRLSMTAMEGQLAYAELVGAGGQLLSGTADEANANATLCCVEGEYMAYQNATLIDTNVYSLQMTKRGIFSTDAKAHAGGVQFVRVDDSIAKVGPLDLKLVGQTFYFKFTSFNVYGNSEQDISTVSAYQYTVTRDVSVDNLLTPPEKPGVKLEYDKLLAEQPGLDAQAAALGVGTEVTEYDRAVANMIEYFKTLNSPVRWDNLNGNTILPY